MDIKKDKLPKESLYHTAEVMPDTWAFTDGLGRKSLSHDEVGDAKEDKTLAMFYWTWHTHFGKQERAINMQAFLDKQDAAGIPRSDYLYDYNYEGWEECLYYWNEPIYGFYRSEDKWVVRRHAELLANAGVDVVFTDNTNGNATWPDGYQTLFETWLEARNNGVKAPCVSMMLPFFQNGFTTQQLGEFYFNYFTKEEYEPLYYYLDGKPMVMAHPEYMGDSELENKLREHFTFRPGQPGYFVPFTFPGNWGWLAKYPQAPYFATEEDQKDFRVEQVTAGVSQNADYTRNMLTAMNAPNVTGRSYTSSYPDRYEKEGDEATKWGYNFAEQFTHALWCKPKVIFVTGFNEWNARLAESWPNNECAVENAIPDTFNDEYSRDIEPTKGRLKDHYYYQLVNFVRKFKGVRPLPSPSAPKTIDLNAGQEQWRDVAPYYAAYIGNTDDRHCDGYVGYSYTETSGRNDIIGAQIARDGENLYFNVECAEDITPCTDDRWMNLYLEIEGLNAPSWESFHFVVRGGCLYRFTGNGFACERVCALQQSINGRYLTVKIPQNSLCLADLNRPLPLHFLWTDNVHDENDADSFTGNIMEFYTSGDVAPGGRFRYTYVL